MLHFHKNLRPGLRMVKTAISVILSILLVRQFAQEPLSVFYAAFGALISMETTFSKSIMQGLTQLIGVLAGTLVGYLSVFLFPEVTPAWFIGVGILLLLLLSNILNLSFTASLSCIIFLSACLTPTDNIFRDSLLRLRDTSIGVGIALAVNVLIRPYNNKKRIVYLLRKLRCQISSDLEQMVVKEQYPNLQECVDLLRRIDQETALYHSQRFFHRKNNCEALLGGCQQLAHRMLEELEAICGMDSLGDLATENAAVMQQLGMELPEAGLSSRKCTRHDTIVMNYHLYKLLSAYQYLSELIETSNE